MKIINNFFNQKLVVFTVLILAILIFFNDHVCEANDVSKSHKFILKGANRTKKESIENLIKTHLNNEINEENLNQLLTILYETNLFKDVKIDYTNDILTIYVDENKIIRNVIIKGDNAIKDKGLKEKINLQPGVLLNQDELEQLRKKVIAHCKEIGYFNAIVEKNIEDLDANYVDVSLNIKKGKLPKIKEIKFTGNSAFTSEQLEKALIFKKYNLLRFFSKMTSYHKDLVTMNKEEIEKFYTRHGYLNFKLLNTDVRLSDEGKLIISFDIEEGRQFIVSDIKVKTDLPVPESALKIIYSGKNKVFNRPKFENDLKKINHAMQREKIYADINFDYKEVAGNKIDLIFDVQLMKNHFIGKIYIYGNSRTQDFVIRNQISLHEGDIFNPESIQASYRRIYNLGFFDNVQIEHKIDPETNKINLIVNVIEKRTGELEFKAGYSSINGLLGGVGYYEKNVLGAGNILGFSIQKGANQFATSTSYYQNNIFDSVLGAGASLFYDNYRNEKLHFNNRDYGGTVSTSIPLYDNLFLNLRYGLKFNKIYDVAEAASENIKAQKPKTTSSSVMYQFVFDRRNIIDYPTNGYYLAFSQDFAGIGGDKHYVSSEITTRVYKTLFNFGADVSDEKSLVLQIKNNFGHLLPFKDYVLRIDDRFFLSELRGFEQINGVCPRDKKDKVLGGDKYFFGSIQVEAPIPLVRDFDIKAHAFIDYGAISVHQENIFTQEDIMNEKAEIFNNKKLRLTMGVGINFSLPMIGLIGIDFGIPLLYDNKLDKRQKIYFSMGKKL